MKLDGINYGAKLFGISIKSIIKSNADLFNIPIKFKINSSKDVSNPIYLLEMSLRKINGELITIRLSSAGPKMFNGVLFGGGDSPSVNVSDLSNQSVKIEMDNSNQLYTFFALSDDIPLKSQIVKLWFAYNESDEIDNNNSMQIFSGYIDEIKEISERSIIYTAVSQSVTASWTPRIFLAPPICNHLPKAGTKIGNLILEPARR